MNIDGYEHFECDHENSADQNHKVDLIYSFYDLVQTLFNKNSCHFEVEIEKGSQEEK